MGMTDHLQNSDYREHLLGFSLSVLLVVASSSIEMFSLFLSSFYKK